jgi:hypothetical protein
MIFKTNLHILFHVFACIHIAYVNGNDCFDNSPRSNCKCSTGETGAIGTCICFPTNVRHGQLCAYDLVNGVDSVSS